MWSSRLATPTEVWSVGDGSKADAAGPAYSAPTKDVAMKGATPDVLDMVKVEDKLVRGKHISNSIDRGLGVALDNTVTNCSRPRAISEVEEEDKERITRRACRHPGEDTVVCKIFLETVVEAGQNRKVCKSFISENSFRLEWRTVGSNPSDGDKETR